MYKLLAALTAMASILSSGMSPAPGQGPPPGYELVQITATPYREFSPRMNSRGQIVFTAQLAADHNSREIFLYDDQTGEVTQLTDNNVQDNSPAVNDEGTITWVRSSRASRIWSSDIATSRRSRFRTDRPI